MISLLRGDLDWIVMKALEKDRTRRYETANGLAMDIQRHLNNEPVMARPPSRLYRLQKLVRRNKIVFAAGGAVALALLAGLGLSTWLFFRERETSHREARLRAEADDRTKITQAVMFVGQGQYDDAEEILKRLRSRSFQSHAGWGVCVSIRGRMDGASQPVAGGGGMLFRAYQN